MRSTIGRRGGTESVSGASVSWASRLAWDHFVRFSFAKPRSAEWARRYFENYFVPRLALRCGLRICYIGEVEAGPWNETIHLHACLFGTAQLTGRELQEVWRMGQVHALAFDSALRGVAYVTKHWEEAHTEILLDDHRLRHRAGRRGRRSRSDRRRMLSNQRLIRGAR